ncbi:MAG: hypothetical protein V7K67_17835 [Nostoc sp.]|uniref:hypothetical protein n=1 Tax=Nostoc sp. TaxID=1180 RepID=UPI002FF8654E
MTETEKDTIQYGSDKVLLFVKVFFNVDAKRLAAGYRQGRKGKKKERYNFHK